MSDTASELQPCLDVEKGLGVSIIHATSLYGRWPATACAFLIRKHTDRLQPPLLQPGASSYQAL
jgi:hypothetical protein